MNVFLLPRKFLPASLSQVNESKNGRISYNVGPPSYKLVYKPQ